MYKESLIQYVHGLMYETTSPEVRKNSYGFEDAVRDFADNLGNMDGASPVLARKLYSFLIHNENYFEYLKQDNRIEWLLDRTAKRIVTSARSHGYEDLLLVKMLASDHYMNESMRDANPRTPRQYDNLVNPLAYKRVKQKTMNSLIANNSISIGYLSALKAKGSEIIRVDNGISRYLSEPVLLHDVKSEMYKIQTPYLFAKSIENKPTLPQIAALEISATELQIYGIYPLPELNPVNWGNN